MSRLSKYSLLQVKTFVHNKATIEISLILLRRLLDKFTHTAKLHGHCTDDTASSPIISGTYTCRAKRILFIS